MALQDITVTIFQYILSLGTVLLYVQEKCLPQSFNYMTRQFLYLPGVLISVNDISGSYYKDVTTRDVQYAAEVPT
jgi:hypothetical protein